jgi:ATP-binding cassette, subfamily C, bacterial CydD
MVTALAQKQSTALLYAVGAWACKYLSINLIGTTLLHLGNDARHRARTMFFSLLSARSLSRGYVGDLVQHADRLGQLPSVQASYASLRLAPVSLLIMFLAGGWMSATVAVLLVAISIPLYIKAGRDSELLGGQYEIAHTDLELRELQVLESGQELRGLGASEFAAEEIAALSAREHLSAMKAVRAALQSSLITEFLSGVAIGLVAMISGFALLGSRTTLLRALIAILFTNELFSAVRRFGSEFHQSEEAEAALKVFNSPKQGHVSREILPSASELVALPGRRPVSLTLKPGQRVLITGPSGSGKTTLLEALVGLRPPHSGAVSPGSSSIAYVTPREYLFSGSLRQNLDPSGHHGDATLHDALRRVGLSTPRFQNLDAALGPNGEGLSSGEQVRFLIARGIVAQAPLFVIDDIAGLFDKKTRQVLAKHFASQPDLCVVEASIDTPLVAPQTTIELRT